MSNFDWGILVAFIRFVVMVHNAFKALQKKVVDLESKVDRLGTAGAYTDR